jgi:acetolactate decarboxylase
MFRKTLCIIFFSYFNYNLSLAKTLVQVGTFKEFKDGKYEGDFIYNDLFKHEVNHGLGAPEMVDGETIIWKDKVYEIKSTGKVYERERNVKTPFSWGVKFVSDLSFSIEEEITLDNLELRLFKQAINKNKVYAIHISGIIVAGVTRSCPKAKSSNVSLIDIQKTQKTFRMEKKPGELIGYYFPERLGEINIPGYHFHFLAKDKNKSGHVLNIKKMKNLNISVMEINSLLLQF